MQHPNDQHLQRFVAGRLNADQEKIINNHLARCPECTKRVSEMERNPLDPLMQNMKAVAASDEEGSSETIAHDARLPEESFSDSNSFTGGDVLGGNLRLEEKLGRGGMGEAWKASDLMAGRNVVVKLVPPEVRHVEAAMGQVRETFQKVHALQHQHICPMMNLVDDPTYGVYVVMKFINGKTLDIYRKDYVAQHGQFSVTEAIRILWDVARALDYSHERKVLHRDIKPQNIMISPEDGVQLIDFGLAAEIRSSMMQISETPMDMAGTRPYMAPEQWRGRLQDAKTDQYALAVTAYELIAGYQPFQGNDVAVLRECVLNEQPEPLAGIPTHINAALLKALSKKREDRFPDCKSFIRAMAERSKTEKEAAVPPAPVIPLDRPVGFAPPPPPPAATMPEPAETVATTSERDDKPVAQKNVGKFTVIGLTAGVLLLGLLGFFLVKSPSKSPRPNVAVVPAPEPPKGAEPVDEAPADEGSGSSNFTQADFDYARKVRERLRTIPSAKLKIEFPDTGAAYGRFTPDSKTFVVNNIKFGNWVSFDIATGKRTTQVQFPSYTNGTDTNGKIAATGAWWSPISKIVLWNIESGVIVREILGHGNGYVDAIRFSSDGSFFASGATDTTAAIWDTKTGEERRRFRGHAAEVYAVDISPDGKLLATGGKDGTVRLWDIETGKELHCLRGHSNKEVRAVVFNHRGTLLATGARDDNAVIFWDVKTARPVKRPIICDGGAVGLGFSPDDIQLAVGGNYPTSSAVWDVETRLPLYRLPTAGDRNLTAAFSPDGTMIATCSRRSLVKIWETPTREEIVRMEQELKAKRETGTEILLREMPPPEIAQVGNGFWHWDKFDSEGGRYENSLWAHAPSRYVFALDKRWKTFKTNYGLRNDADSNVANCIFIVKGDEKELFRSGEIRDHQARPLELDVGNVDKLELIVDSNGPNNWDLGIWFTPMLLRDKAPAEPPIQTAEDFAFPGRTWEEVERLQKVREKLRTIPDAKAKVNFGPTFSLGEFTPDGKKFVAGSHPEKGGRVFDLATGDAVVKIDYSHYLGGTDVHPDGRTAVSGAENGVILHWDIESGKILREIKAHNGWMDAVRFSRDGSFFASASKDATVAIWDTATGEEQKRFRGYSGWVNSLDISPDGTLLATGSRDGTVWLWDIKTEKVLYRLKGHFGSFSVVRFNHRGTVLASGSRDRSIIFWDVKSGTPLRRLLECEGIIHAIGFSPDDSRLAVTCANGCFSCVWDVETCLPLYRLPTADVPDARTATFSKDGKTIATCVRGKSSTIWEVPAPEKLLQMEQELKTKRETAREILLREMSPPEYGQVGFNPERRWETFESAEEKHENSLWAHAHSRYVFRLDKRWKTFKTGYGLEKNSNLDHANVICIIKGDGKELFRSEEIKDHTARPLELDVSDVELLELIVDPNGSTYCDGAVWFTPTLLRDGTEKHTRHKTRQPGKSVKEIAEPVERNNGLAFGEAEIQSLAVGFEGTRRMRGNKIRALAVSQGLNPIVPPKRNRKEP